MFIMLYDIFTLNKDELLYSWVGRYSAVAGDKGYFKNRIELFGQKYISVNIFFAYYLEHLSTVFPEEFNISADKLIMEHTIFPFFKPFISKQKSEETIEWMKNGGGNYLVHMGLFSAKAESDVIYYCPLCFKEDEGIFSESYIHRIHQIPGNLICHKHHIYLNRYELINDRRTHHFKDINSLEIDKINIKKIETKYESYFIGDSGFKEIVRTVKTEDDYAKLRTQEKLLIEKTYWDNRGVDWGVVLHNEEIKVIGRNIYSIYQEYFWNDSIGFTDDEMKFLIDKFKNYLTNWNMNILEATEVFEKDMTWEEGEGLNFFKYLLSHKAIQTDFSVKFNYHEMRVWF